VVIWSVGEMVAAPVGYAYVADIAPEHLRGRYQGAYGTAWGVGSVTGPALGTLLFAHSPTLLWAVCGVLGAAAAVIVLGGKPALPPRREDLMVVIEESHRRPSRPDAIRSLKRTPG